MKVSTLKIKKFEYANKRIFYLEYEQFDTLFQLGKEDMIHVVVRNNNIFT